MHLVQCEDILQHLLKWLMMIRCYTELIIFESFKERFDYLKLDGSVGVSTFGFDRYINQAFYASAFWKKLRDEIIIRDSACDLGILDRPIFGNIRIHHMNPITIEDLELRKDIVINPEYLICVSLNTHNAIHFGNEKSLHKIPEERKKGDTNLWKIEY